MLNRNIWVTCNRKSVNKIISESFVGDFILNGSWPESGVDLLGAGHNRALTELLNSTWSSAGSPQGTPIQVSVLRVTFPELPFHVEELFPVTLRLHFWTPCPPGPLAFAPQPGREGQVQSLDGLPWTTSPVISNSSSLPLGTVCS